MKPDRKSSTIIKTEIPCNTTTCKSLKSKQKNNNATSNRQKLSKNSNTPIRESDEDHESSLNTDNVAKEKKYDDDRTPSSVPQNTVITSLTSAKDNGNEQKSSKKSNTPIRESDEEHESSLNPDNVAKEKNYDDDRTPSSVPQNTVITSLTSAKDNGNEQKPSKNSNTPLRESDEEHESSLNPDNVAKEKNYDDDRTPSSVPQNIVKTSVKDNGNEAKENWNIVGTRMNNEIEAINENDEETFVAQTDMAQPESVEIQTENIPDDIPSKFKTVETQPSQAVCGKTSCRGSVCNKSKVKHNLDDSDEPSDYLLVEGPIYVRRSLLGNKDADKDKDADAEAEHSRSTKKHGENSTTRLQGCKKCCGELNYCVEDLLKACDSQIEAIVKAYQPAYERRDEERISLLEDDYPDDGMFYLQPTHGDADGDAKYHYLMVDTTTSYASEDFNIQDEQPEAEEESQPAITQADWTDPSDSQHAIKQANWNDPSSAMNSYFVPPPSTEFHEDQEIVDMAKAEEARYFPPSQSTEGHQGHEMIDMEEAREAAGERRLSIAWDNSIIEKKERPSFLPVKAPVEEAPVEEAPMEEAPVEEAPMEEAPVEEAPMEEAPVEGAPVEEAPVEEAPVDEASAKRASMKPTLAKTIVPRTPHDEEVPEDISHERRVSAISWRSVEPLPLTMKTVGPSESLQRIANESTKDSENFKRGSQQSGRQASVFKDIIKEEKQRSLSKKMRTIPDNVLKKSIVDARIPPIKKAKCCAWIKRRKKTPKKSESDMIDMESMNEPEEDDEDMNSKNSNRSSINSYQRRSSPINNPVSEKHKELNKYLNNV